MKKEIIGDCELYLGDCREILPTLGKVDAVVTDPPYGIANTNGGSINDKKAKGDYWSYIDNKINLASLVKHLSFFINDRNIVAAITCGKTNMWLYPEPNDVGIFYQPAATSMSYWGRATWQPILFYGRDPFIGKTIHPLHFQLTEQPEKNGHPCPKPIKTWTALVSRATKDTDIVLDPFMGSGTTGVACVKLGRKFIGIELEPKYFDIACKRIEEAYKQPDFFVPQPIKTKQEVFL